MYGTDLLFGPLTATFIIGILTFLLIYWYGTRNHDYWRKRDVPYVKPLPFIGSVGGRQNQPLHDMEVQRYRELGPIYGHFEGNKPLLSVADPALLRDILVKDFQHFPNRRTFQTGNKMFDSMLSLLQGEDWKRVRSIVSPTFSTGKIKRLQSIFKDCTKTLVQNFRKLIEEGKSIDVKSLYGALTMDVIASSAFSTKIDSHNDPDNEFIQTAKIVVGRTINWKFYAYLLFPGLMKFLGIPAFSPHVLHFFRTVTMQIIEERRRTGQVRNDFLQLLIDTAKEVAEEEKWDSRDKEDVTSNYDINESGQETHRNVSRKHLSMDELMAQCMIFFLAGYDTTSSALSFVTYMLALNPDVQDRLRIEVDTAFEENNGELTYEAIQGMKYLDNVISETLRLFPPLARLERPADTNYVLRGKDIAIEKGTIVTIPIYAIHRDAKYYPDPLRFDPDRFSPEEKQKRNQYTYFPFGAGPRNCVGMRFALVEIKFCLAEVIANFKIKKSPMTKVPLDFLTTPQGLLQVKEIFVDMEVRKDSPIKK